MVGKRHLPLIAGLQKRENVMFMLIARLNQLWVWATLSSVMCVFSLLQNERGKREGGVTREQPQNMSKCDQTFESLLYTVYNERL